MTTIQESDNRFNTIPIYVLKTRYYNNNSLYSYGYNINNQNMLYFTTSVLLNNMNNMNNETFKLTPDATLSLLKDPKDPKDPKGIHHRQLHTINSNIIYQNKYNIYEVAIMHGNFTLEDFCKDIINVGKGESYDCHSPDIPI